MARICIDAGHGGRDPGAVGPVLKVRESNIVLSLANLVYSGLAAAGHQVRLTRTSDVFVELGERCRIANAWSAQWFVSLHLNSDGPTAVGIETLHKTNNGKALATPIQRALINGTGERDRGLKVRNDLAVLNGTNMPAALVEYGFVSNRETEAKFNTDAYRRLLAECTVLGLTQFLGSPAVKPPVVTPPTPVVEMRVPRGVEIRLTETTATNAIIAMQVPRGVEVRIIEV